MTHRRLSRAFVFLLVLVVALPLAMAQRRPSALAPVAGADEIRTLPELPAPNREVLVGEISCFHGPFNPEAQIAFRANGTIPLEQDDAGILISRILEPSEENPCPAVLQGATARVQGLGCVAGPAGNSNVKFVCHDRRENLVAVMAAMSEGVLTGF